MDICRTCAEQSSKDLVPIFSKLEDKFIANVIINCSSVTINEDDGLPSYVCSNCLASVKEILRFAQKVRESDRKLRLLFKSESLAAGFKKQEQEPGDGNFIIIPLEVSLEEIKLEVEGEDQGLKEDETNVLESEQESGDFKDVNDSVCNSDGMTSDDEPVEEEVVIARRSRRNTSAASSSDQGYDKPKRRRWRKPLKDYDEENDGEISDLDEVEQQLYKLVQAEPNRFFCCLCYKDYETRSELVEHGKQKHLKKTRRVNYSKKYACDVCHCRYVIKDSLTEHQAITAKLSSQKIYECLRCSHRFVSIKRRRYHAHNHPKYAAVPNPNDVDNDGEISDLDEVEQQVYKLVQAGPSRFFCCLCYMDYETRSELVEHGKQKHSKKTRNVNYSKMHACDVCHSRYVTKEALMEHQAITAKLSSQKIHECLRCSNRFVSIKRRRFHAHNHPKYAAVPNPDLKEKRKSYYNKIPSKEEFLQHGKKEHSGNRSLEVGNYSDWNNDGKTSDDEPVEEEVVTQKNKRKTAATTSSDRENDKLKRRRWRKPLKDYDDENDGEISDLDEVEQQMYKLVQSGPSRFFCCLCYKDYETRNKLLEHGKQKHSKKTRKVNFSKMFACDVCHCRYVTKDALTEHQAITAKLSSQKIYECLRCSNRFVAIKRRRYHAHNHPKYAEVPDPDLEEKRKRLVKCCKNGCYKKFTTKEEFLEHGKKEHSGNRPLIKDPTKPHECPVCFKGFENLQSMKRHSYKMFEPCMQCSICGREFKARHSLITHERQHNDDKPFACEVCGKRFAIRSQLQLHMVVHKDDKPFVCAVCGWSFKRECNLKIHMLQHSDTLPWKCDVCGKCFKGKYHLQYHKRTHTGHKPWKCGYCEKSFADHANKNRHEKSHTGNPFKCSYCDKSFIRRRFQIEHESTHTGIKPYRCELCNRTFSQKSSLKKHLDMHPLAPENQVSLEQTFSMQVDSSMSPPPPPSTAVSSAILSAD